MYQCKRGYGIVLSLILVLSLVMGNMPAQMSQAAKKAILKTKTITVVKSKTKTIKLKNKKSSCKYTFKSNKKKVATVTSKGKVKGVRVGTAKITVKEITKKGKGKSRKVGTVTVKVKKKTSTTTNTNTSTNTNTNPVSPTQAPVVTDQPKVTDQPDNTPKGASVKVYTDSVIDANLIAEAEGVGIVPTPTPAPTYVAPTPVPTPQVIYDVDFEDGKATPFEKRSSTIEVADGGANGSAKCLHVSGRTSNWNGTQIKVNDVVAIGNKYDISFYVKQTTGDTQDVNVSLQHNETYPGLKTQSVPTDVWTKVSFTTTEIPEFSGDIYLYWQLPKSADGEFYIDDFTCTGVVNTVSNKVYTDLSNGLKKTTVGNPIISSRMTADPFAMEYNGRVYVYGTNDSQQYEATPGDKNGYGAINTINCYSSADMVNWTDHGAIPVAGKVNKTGAAKWAANSWAPAACHKTIDGKEKFFLYFADNGSGIGVLTSDSPTGPWVDPLGEQIISRKTPNCSGNEVPWLFDPAVLVDDDGTGYLYFGGIGEATDRAHPKCARVVKLAEDMIHLEGEPVAIDSPYMFEDSGINKIGDKYYYSYCTNFDAKGKVDGIEGNGNIAVMVSDNPMTGFALVGQVLSNPSTFGLSGGNNHHCFAEFKGTLYAFYHTQKDSMDMKASEGYRTTYADVINLGEKGNFTNNDGSVAATKMTKKGVAAVGTINPYEIVEAECFALEDGIGTVANELDSSQLLWKIANRSLINNKMGSTIGVAEVDFGTDGATKVTLKLSDTLSNEYKEVTVALKKKVTGKHTLYFSFDKSNVLMDSWKFSK